MLRDDFSRGSDVDILVEFEEGKTPGLAIVDMQDELSEMIGRVVDLRTEAELSRYFRDKVVMEVNKLWVKSEEESDSMECLSLRWG